MNADEIRLLFPKASEAFIRANTTPDSPRPTPKLERRSGNGSLAKSKVKGPVPARVLVRVTSYRCRLLDEDNLCEKFAVDCCRYSGLIPGDGPKQAKIEVCQEEVGSKAEERTLIEIIPFP